MAHTTARMWTAALDLAATLRTDLTTPTSRTWKRPPRQCPPWCAGGHQCSAQHGYPAGQHRSEPVAVQASYGTLVATRVAGHPGNQVELRAVVNLPESESDAAILADRIATGVHLTITALTRDHPADIVRAEVIRPAVAPAGRHALPENGRTA